MNLKTLLVSTAFLALSTSAVADMKNVDKLRKIYREHNLDFFGDLISDSSDFLEDEKRHAKLELLADDARTRALNQLQFLLKNARGEMEGELLIRKATLLSDRARTATYFQNNPFKASKLKAPTAYLRESISVFQNVEKRFGSHPRMDVVTFSIAYNFGELREPDNAYRYYDRLVSRYAASPLVGDARLAMAEILFDKRKFREALAQLQEIVKSEHPRLKNFALYKMSWTYYNLADLDSAMNALERVIQGVNSQGVQHARLELRKEALHDLVAFYAELPVAGAPAKALEYFERVGATPDAIAKEYDAARAKRIAAIIEKKQPLPEEETEPYRLSEAKELLFRLVSVYRDQGKHESALNVSEQLIAALDRHPRVPALYRVLAESAEKMRRRDLVLAALERLAKLAIRDVPAVSEYSSGLPEAKLASMSDYFAAAKATEKEMASPLNKLEVITAASQASGTDGYRNQLSKTAFDTFRDFSSFIHGEWAKTQNASIAKNAIAVYGLALGALLHPWRGAPLAACFELVHHRAELYFALKQWDAAAQDFHWLTLHAQSTDLAPKSSLSESLRGEIASLEAWIKEAPGAQTKGSIGPVHARLIAAYDAFLAFNLTQKSERKNTADILAASSRLLKEHGRTEEALQRMSFYALHLDGEKDAAASTRDVLAILEKAMRWEELRDFSRTILERSKSTASALEKELRQANQYASLRLLENLEKEKDWKKATREFADFAKSNPESPFLSQALMKSANAAIEMKDTEAAIARLEEATHAPDTGVRLQAWLGLEPYYRKAYQWRKLENLYEQALKLSPDAKTAASAKNNLAAIKALEAAKFQAEGEKLIVVDPDLEKTLSSLEKFDRGTRDYYALRFKRTNNNPSQNFKRKADLHAQLTSQLEKLVGNVPKTLQAGVAVWSDVARAELLLELADTIDDAAVPAQLAGATDADRKAYRETLDSQTKDVRANARQLAEDSVKRLAEANFPAPIELRLGKLLERLALPIKLTRQSFAQAWAKRPHDDRKKKEFDAAKLARVGLEVLKSEKREDADKAQLELAQIYADFGEPGLAFATASALIGSGAEAEIAGKAIRLQYEINAARLPTRIKKAIADDTFDPAARWNLARWLASQNTEKGDFSKEEAQWFSEAVGVLLRIVRAEQTAVAAH